MVIIMKKLIALVMAGMMVVSLGTTALAAGGHHGRGAGSGQGQGQGMGQNWVDADGDGVCDNYGTNCQGTGCGTGCGHDSGHGGHHGGRHS